MSQGTRYCMALDNAAWESFGGESILIDFATGSYFSLSVTASDIVTLAAAGLDSRAIAASLAQRYADAPAGLQGDVDGLLQRAVEAGVLAPRQGAATAEVPALDGPPGAYEAPSLDKYEDMQEMLLLDPIHGLDEDGWPRADRPTDDAPTA